VLDMRRPRGIGRRYRRRRDAPTGALDFRRLDGGEQEPKLADKTIQLRPNGPLFVQVKVRIEEW
jgi:hypothetical protein